MKENNFSRNKIKKIEDSIIDENNARNIFLYAYSEKKVDKEKLARAILKTNNSRYINLFFYHFNDIYRREFFDKILSFNNSKDIFYAIYNSERLEDIYFFGGLKKLIILEDKKYISLLCYYYFVILNRYNKDMLKIASKVMEHVTKNNVKKKATIELEKYKVKVKEYNKFCCNKFLGHNNIVPDIIVCHISMDYGKIIETFYDENSKVSSHFAVSRKGSYTQFVDLKDSAWANGTSLNSESDVYYKFAKSEIVKTRKMNANYYTYSIEHESFDGTLTKEQYDCTIRLMCKIIDYIKENYGKNFEIDEKHIIGHIDVNPIVRTKCPGNKFPIKNIIHDLQKIYNYKEKK